MSIRKEIYIIKKRTELSSVLCFFLTLKFLQIIIQNQTIFMNLHYCFSLKEKVWIVFLPWQYLICYSSENIKLEIYYSFKFRERETNNKIFDNVIKFNLIKMHKWKFLVYLELFYPFRKEAWTEISMSKKEVSYICFLCKPSVLILPGILAWSQQLRFERNLWCPSDHA